MNHVEEGFLDDTVLMDPEINRGRRVLPSDVDKALLADIGYEIEGFTTEGETAEIVTENNEEIEGTIADDDINALGGDDSISGDEGNDNLNGGTGEDYLYGNEGNDTINGGAGDDFLYGDALSFTEGGSDRFIIEPDGGDDTINNFFVAEDAIEISGDLGFRNSDEVLDAISTSSSFLGRRSSELTLDSENKITINHDDPLSEANFIVQPSQFPDEQLFLGDSNGDGNYTALDAALIARVAEGLDDSFGAYPSTEPLSVGDFTGDGIISVLDAVNVARTAVGLSTEPEISDLSTFAISNS